jgi:hypothetical protein
MTEDDAPALQVPVKAVPIGPAPGPGPIVPPPPPEPVFAFVLYEPNGRLSMRFTGTDSDGANTAANNGKPLLKVDERLNPELQYVAGGAIADRPPNPAVLTGTTLTNVPVPSTLWIDDTSYPVTDPTVELDLTLPGTYQLRLESFPPQDAAFTVVVP